MFKGYTTYKGTVEKRELDLRALQIMCVAGRTFGAVKFGSDWTILCR